ncbi:proline dehydrogenase family protein [Apibacter raozihei]|uniref:proline dehydrogenase family protein n=1 Tax=Apibacter TaxID=1778601 RepID=UPI000FE410B2|nr:MULTISPECIES: proline dehydrogenase family protein [Apibacter]
MNPFSDTEVAFKLKSDKDLKKAKFLFSCIQSPTVTKMGVSLLNTVIKWDLPFVKSTVKSTLFNHFCGGETMQECIPVVEKMHQLGVSSILDYSVEGKVEEETFNRTFNETINNVNFSVGNSAIPFVVFKPTGFGRLELYEKIGSKQTLSPEEQKEWERVVERYYKVAELCYEKDVTFMIDAEESWMQDAVDDLTEELMKKFNTKRCIVCGTIQMYRTGRLEFLKSQFEKAKQGGYFIGFKIVRGAYMEKERERAQEKGYPSPIQPDKESTDKQYDDSVKFMIENNDIISLYAGTHNEISCTTIMELLKEKHIENNFHKVWFGQLYGMSDNISFKLGKDGYNIAKYLPYGPVADVVPYLTRRAEENTSVAGQTGRELSYIQKELQRRNK